MISPEIIDIREYRRVGNNEVRQSIPYDEIDPGIVAVVRLLNNHGFRTLGSCQGGDGHAFHLPRITIESNGDLDDTRQALCQFLLARGGRSFSVSTISMHQHGTMPEPYSHVLVEFWSQETLWYVTT